MFLDIVFFLFEEKCINGDKEIEIMLLKIMN